MSKIAVVIYTIFMVFVCGCTSDEANRRYIYDLPARPYKTVEVLWTKPECKYTVVADFQAIGANEKYMKKLAGKVGADAVILVPAGGEYLRSESWASEDRRSKKYQRLLGTAIKYEN